MWAQHLDPKLWLIGVLAIEPHPNLEVLKDHCEFALFAEYKNLDEDAQKKLLQALEGAMQLGCLQEHF